MFKTQSKTHNQSSLQTLTNLHFGVSPIQLTHCWTINPYAQSNSAKGSVKYIHKHSSNPVINQPQLALNLSQTVSLQANDANTNRDKADFINSAEIAGDLEHLNWPQFTAANWSIYIWPRVKCAFLGFRKSMSKVDIIFYFLRCTNISLADLSIPCSFLLLFYKYMQLKYISLDWNSDNSLIGCTLHVHLYFSPINFFWSLEDTNKVHI